MQVAVGENVEETTVFSVIRIHRQFWNSPELRSIVKHELVKALDIITDFVNNEQTTSDIVSHYRKLAEVEKAAIEKTEMEVAE